MTIPTKLIAYIVLAVFIAGSGYWFNGVLNDRKQYRDENVRLIAESQAKTDIINQERARVAQSEAREKETISAKKVIEDAYNDRLKCIADKSCGVSIKWQKAICAAVPNSNASESGSDGGARSDLRDLSTWDADVERSINKNHQLIKDLQKEYAIKSAPDYCQPKVK